MPLLQHEEHPRQANQGDVEKLREYTYLNSLTVTLYLNPSISDIRNWYGFTTTAPTESSLVSATETMNKKNSCLPGLVVKNTIFMIKT